VQASRHLLMLATNRVYGLKCLSACGELEEGKREYAAYYSRLARMIETHLLGEEQATGILARLPGQGVTIGNDSWNVSNSPSRSFTAALFPFI
jgi:hypothetical protein